MILKERRIKRAFISIILDDQERRRKLFLFLEIILFIISFIMSAINVVTGNYPLLLSTFTMGVLSLANSFLFYRKNRVSTIVGVVIFSIKMFGLFTYFIISGGTEGFSTIWLLMLPACGMFAFGKKNGAILSGILFLELAIFFYTPLRNTVIIADYTDSFMLRFPVVYLCFFFVGIYLEYVREITHEHMNTLRLEAKNLSIHDALTGVFNRLGFNQVVESYIRDAQEGTNFALLILDADFFKKVNDKYGHDTGDIVLKTIAERVTEIVANNGVVCRWGGEEFAVILNPSVEKLYKEIAELIRNEIKKPIDADKFMICISASIGGVSTAELEEITLQKVLSTADKRLYRAKEEGRDRVICG